MIESGDAIVADYVSDQVGANDVDDVGDSVVEVNDDVHALFTTNPPSNT